VDLTTFTGIEKNVVAFLPTLILKSSV